MAVSSISSTTSSSYVQKPKAPTASSKTDALATAVQEANETRVTTEKEARAGDQIAIAKLRRLNQANNQQQTPDPSDSRGKQVDQHG